MQTDFWNCLRCKQEYHPNHNYPRILYTCGHTFCSQCLKGILEDGRCPFDSKPVPPDTFVEQLPVDSRVLATFPALCPRHQKPEDLICLREYRRICIDCKEECLFQRHKIKVLGEIEAEAENKTRALQDIVDEFDPEYDEIDTILNNQKEALINEMENTFEFLQQAIESTKNQIISTIQKFFEKQKEITDELYNHDYQLKERAKDALQTLEQNSFGESFFNALYTRIGGLQIHYQKPRVESFVNTIENDTEAIKAELMTLLARIPTLLTIKDHNLEDSHIEENRGHTSTPSPNHTEILDEVSVEQEQPRTTEEEEEEEPTENPQKVAKLFNAEIGENDRLVLSFKTQREDMETEEESLLSDQEKLKSVEKVTLQINRSTLWKEAIESLRWIWRKLGKVIDFKVDFSWKARAKDILKVLLEQNNVWATHDLSEFAIDLSESQVHDKAVKKLYEKAISKMVHLRKLEIVLENTKITDKSVKKFAEKTLPNLTRLADFRFYIDNTKVSDEAMERLLISMHHKKVNLTGLAFGLDGTAVTDKTLENIAKNISPLASELTKLDLSANKTDVTDASLKLLFESLPLSNLREFTLDLGCTKVSNEGFKYFFQRALPEMASLEVFELFLNEQTKITNKMIKPIAKSLHLLSGLKKICLELGGTGINGKTLIALERYALKNKPVLESFEIYVAETKIKDVDINDFFMKVEKEQDFKNLRTLSFCFSKLHVTDDGCQLLAKSIQACEHLETLKLQLGKTKVSDKGLDYLSHGINQVLQRIKLTEFQLYLDSTEVTDTGLKVLSNQVVRSLIGVKSFELYLTRVQGVTDQGVGVLLTDLSTVAGSLKNIDLSLYETKITDGCMEVLSNTLWKTKMNLESFILSVGKNKEITDKSIGCCLNNFGGILKNLKGLTLGIEETRISQKGLGLLKCYLNENPNALEKIEIESGDDKNLHKIIKDLQSLLV